MAKISISLVNDQHRRHVNKETALLLQWSFAWLAYIYLLVFFNGMFSPLMLTVNA